MLISYTGSQDNMELYEDTSEARYLDRYIIIKKKIVNEF